jgi:hypothetical protein
MYTNKDSIRVVAIVGSMRVEGDFHVLAGSRLTDALNSKNKDYFALTNARVSACDSDAVLYAPSYAAINRASITLIFPLE